MTWFETQQYSNVWFTSRNSHQSFFVFGSGNGTPFAFICSSSTVINLTNNYGGECITTSKDPVFKLGLQQWSVGVIISMYGIEYRVGNPITYKKYIQ